MSAKLIYSFQHFALTSFLELQSNAVGRIYMRSAAAAATLNATQLPFTTLREISELPVLQVLLQAMQIRLRQLRSQKVSPETVLLSAFYV